MGGDAHPVGAGGAERGAAGIGCAGQHSDHLPAERALQSRRFAQRLVGDRADAAIALLDEDQNAHRTFASSRRTRSSSGIASLPAPTIRPAERPSGSVSDTGSSPAGPSSAGFSSIGYFFAAMIPSCDA